jgi:hypothetical protein
MKGNAALAGFAAAFLFAFPARAQELSADSLFALGRFDEAAASYVRRIDARSRPRSSAASACASAGSSRTASSPARRSRSTSTGCS